MLVPLNSSQKASTYKAKTVALLKQFYGRFVHKNMQGLFNPFKLKKLEMQLLLVCGINKVFVVIGYSFCVTITCVFNSQKSAHVKLQDKK